MAGTIVVDRLESDASYASSINIASPIVISNTITGNVNIDNGSLFVNQINNRVGIGTVTPNCALEVNSTSGEPIAFFKSDVTDASIVVAGGVEAYIEFRNISGSSGNGTNSWGSGTNDDLDLHFDYGTNGTMNKSTGASSDHKMLLTNAGNVNIRGYMTKELQPAFSAYVNSSTHNNWTGSAGNVFPFSVAEINRGNHYNTSTYRFTAPVAGIYRFGCRFNRYSDSRFDLILAKNGSSLYTDEIRALQGNSDWDLRMTGWLVSAAVNDYFDLRVGTVVATGTAFVDAGVAHDAFFGYLVA